MSLNGKSVLVIGGSSGIGFATARLARERGASVTIAGRSAEKLTRAMESLGGSVVARPVDVTSEDSVAGLLRELGPLDHIVYTPPGAAIGPVRGLSLDAAQAGLNAKFWGAVRVAKHAQFAEDGATLTLMSGQMARRPRPGLLMGGCANAAVESLARGLAVELAPVRVNAISPGLIDTPLHARLSEDQRAAARRTAENRLPVRRIGRPEEIASMVLEIIGNGFLTGTVIQIDGGGDAVV